MAKVASFLKGILPSRDPRVALLRRMPKGSTCAEIGVWKGDYSEKILAVARPKRLHLIDPWLFQGQYPDRLYGGKGAADQGAMDDIYRSVRDRFESRPNVSIHRDTSEGAAGLFEDGYFDWVYIDGNHYYEFIKADLEIYYHKVRRGGFLAGDDYDWGAEDGFPVKRAVDEFAGRSPVRLEWMRGGQFILRKL